MHGAALTDAVRAADGFIAAKPAPDQIAVVAVASQTKTLATFSADPSNADAALHGLGIDPHYGTVLWDAITAAADALRAEGLPGRTIILVSDGQETRSRATLTDAIKAAQAAHAAIYTVGVPDITYMPRPLQQLAAATGGRFYQALSTAELPGIYAAIGDELRRTWLLSYATAARPGDTVRLNVESSGTDATATINLPARLGTGVHKGGSQPMLILAFVLAASLLLTAATIAIRNFRVPRWRSSADDF
jgi:VWFA-related protein